MWELYSECWNSIYCDFLGLWKEHIIKGKGFMTLFLSLRSTCASRYERASSNASTWLRRSPTSSFWLPERTSNASTAPRCPTPRSYEGTNATVIHLRLLKQALLYILRPTQVCDSENNLTSCWFFLLLFFAIVQMKTFWQIKFLVQVLECSHPHMTLWSKKHS